jgi:predicted Holliday junction resolvase-like endonuclease
VVEESMQVIPELTEEKAKRLLVDNHYAKESLYIYWKKYVVIDTGMRDKSAVIFAHYNYQTKNVIIEKELDLQGSSYNTSKLADLIKQTVDELWHMNYDPKGIRYIGDNNNLIVLQDLNIIYKLPFVPTTKGTLDQMVQKVRDWIYDERILFDRVAEDTLKCCRYAIWSKSRDEFARSARWGHYDALAALIYLIRNVEEFKNPIPELLGYNPRTQFIDPTEKHNVTKNRRELQTVFFNPRKGLSFKDEQ